MELRFLPVLVSVIGLFACTSSNVASRGDAGDDVREAVFRYLFVHNGSGLQSSAAAYFLSVEGDAAPSEAFVARFKDQEPPVRRLSDAIAYDPTQGIGPVDGATGRRGLCFQISSITWLSERSVEVVAGYYESSLSRSASRYQLVWERQRWTVKAEELFLMSRAETRRAESSRVCETRRAT